MFCKIMQGVAVTYIIIGISGAAGAMDRGTGFIQSAVLLLTGSAVMYFTYRKGKDDA